MALSLRHIFEETKKKYHLELVCGEKGLHNILKWVYISEDISTSAFLQGGELIITTGVTSKQSESWLYDFIYALIRQKTCGLILNIGAYIQPQDITKDIRELCSRFDYPLFTMPWETRIFDITHDYYNRIFHDTQTENAITTAFMNLIHRTDNYMQNEAVLAGYGYTPSLHYCVVYLQYRISETVSDTDETINGKILFALEHYLKNRHPNFHLCPAQQYFLIIAPDRCSEQQSSGAKSTNSVTSETLVTDMKNLAYSLESLFPELRFSIGIGNCANSLSEIPRSFLHAQAASAMAFYKDTNCFSFDAMGFFKILLSVNDRSILESYVQEQLGAVLQYDQEHNSDYLATLHQYLLHDGSIQKIAASLFCHRNTVNYRVRILREELGYPLEDMQVRFELMAAFQIREYLMRKQP